MKKALIIHFGIEDRFKLETSKTYGEIEFILSEDEHELSFSKEELMALKTAVDYVLDNTKEDFHRPWIER